MSSDRTVDAGADLAATAALLEIAENIGVSPLLDRAEPFSLAELSKTAQVPERGAAAFLEALRAAGLVTPADGDPTGYVACEDLADRRYQAGYLSWSLTANRPYIDHAHEFLRDPERAQEKFHRDGRLVSVSSRWVGSKGFYQSAFSEIQSRRPARMVDLGAGAGALLINLLRTLPESTAVAIDMSAAACAEAERAAERAGVGSRLGVVNRPIQSLVDDPSPVHDADVVHAGFVMHDLVAEPDTFDAVLRTCRKALGEGGRLVITDAVPYASEPRERAFSALFTYLHAASMGVELPTEAQWREAFQRAGFTDVVCVPLRMPSSRMFLVSG